MPVIHGEPARPANGLSPRTQQLWQAAARYRQLADALAANQARLTLSENAGQ